MKELNCVICKNPKIKNKYTKTCGDLGCRKKLTQQTNLERYGNICNLHSKQGKKQVRKTFLKNYGVGSIAELSKLEDIKKKKIETCRKNFGVDHPQQSKVVRDKSIETLLKKYGVDNISKLPEIIAKIKDIKFTKDPITNVSIYEISRIKNIETCRKKYGVDFYFQTEEFKENYKKVMTEKYGEDNFFKTRDFQELMLDKGKRIPLSERKDREKYYNLVWFFTRITYKNHKNILDKESKRGKDYHLDHIFSVKEGYLNKIDPRIIGSLSNLQLLPKSINIKKQSDCWIELKQLLYLYSKLEKDDQYLDIDHPFNF